MINNEYKCIFIHIPKTGGTSIVKLINAKKCEGFSGNNHQQSLSRYKQRFDNYDNYYKFTVVRNPWDKMVSEYKWFTNTKYKFPGRHVTKHFSDKGFDFFVENFRKLKVGDMSHRREQITFIRPVEDLNKIVRFEHLSTELYSICEHLNIPIDTIPHKHNLSSNMRHYTEYYNDSTRKLVAEQYKNDIEHFGYKFDGN